MRERTKQGRLGGMADFPRFRSIAPGGWLRIVIALLLAAGWPKGKAVGEEGRTGLFWSEQRLSVLRHQQGKTDSAYREALQILRDEARSAADSEVFTVVRKGKAGPSGDIHDYYSLATYWWPDPSKPGGLPFVRRDGQVNPDGRGPDSDEAQMRGLGHAAPTLALSWAIFREENHARHAGKLLRAWMIDPRTRMNPHLTYAQAVPGHNTGRGFGIIDGIHFLRLPDAILQLRGAPGWSAADEAGARRWFSDYLDWLLESAHGADARDTANNHGTWYDVQCVTYARFLGRDDLARRILHEVPRRRIDPQILPDGRQPRELERTRAWTYSVKNLDGLLLLASLSPPDGPDLWNHRGPEGQGLPQALDYLVQFVDPQVPWPHEEIHAKPRTNLIPLVWQAASLPGARGVPTLPAQSPQTYQKRAWLQYGKASQRPDSDPLR